MEILSRSRVEYDRLTKARRYAARGVLHYWIVDPEARTLQCFRLEGGSYRLDASGADRDQVTLRSFEGFTLPSRASGSTTDEPLSADPSPENRVHSEAIPYSFDSRLPDLRDLPVFPIS